MSNVFDISPVLIQSWKDGQWLRVGYISEVSDNGLTSQEWTLLAGFDPNVAERMQFIQATVQDVDEVNAVARCLGKKVVTSFSRDFSDSPTGTLPEIEAAWAVRAEAILAGTCANATFARQGTAQDAIQQISPNFKPAPDQDLTKPWLKVISLAYLGRPFTAEVWYAARVELSQGGSFEIKACDTCAPSYPSPGRYTLIVAPAPPPSLA